MEHLLPPETFPHQFPPHPQFLVTTDLTSLLTLWSFHENHINKILQMESSFTYCNALEIHSYYCKDQRLEAYVHKPRLAGSHQTLKRQGKIVPQNLQRQHGPAGTSISDFRLPEQREHVSVVISTQCVVIHHGSLGERTQHGQGCLCPIRNLKPHTCAWVDLL